jgi:linoleoyl-CoA desaturase
MSQKIKFIDRTHSPFYATVRHRVEAYFQENGISKHANGKMWAKTAFFLGSFLLLYGLILSNQFGLGMMLAMAVLLGMCSAFIGFNISHDALMVPSPQVKRSISS